MSLLDDIVDRQAVHRMIFDGEPPPAPPPHPDARWDKYEEIWVETDESLRRRVLASMGKVRP